MLSPRVGAWASGWTAMPHGRGRDLGQMQGFCLESRAGVLILLRCLLKVNKIGTLYLELLLPLGKFESGGDGW